MWRLRRRVVCVFFLGFGVGTFLFLSFVGWVDGLGFPLFWCIIYSCLLDGGIAHSLCIVLRLAFIFGLVHLISLDAVQCPISIYPGPAPRPISGLKQDANIEKMASQVYLNDSSTC